MRKVAAITGASAAIGEARVKGSWNRVTTCAAAPRLDRMTNLGRLGAALLPDLSEPKIQIAV